MERTRTANPPERIIVKNDDELLLKLIKSRNEAEKGNILTKEQVFGGLKEKYGF